MFKLLLAQIKLSVVCELVNTLFLYHQKIFPEICSNKQTFTSLRELANKLLVQALIETLTECCIEIIFWLISTE